MYPVIKEGVSIGTFKYTGSDTTHYYIENINEEVFEISYTLWDALLHADGSHPLNLPDNDREILHDLKKYGLVRTSRFIRDNGIFNRFVLFPVSSKIQTFKPVLKAVNSALPIMSILIFATGLFCIISNRELDSYDFNWWLYWSLIVVSLTCHEFGHLVAGLANGYEIKDVGLLLFGIIPFGAYVSHEDKEDAKKSEKIQFALAGVEMNLIMAGVALLFATRCCQWSLTMLSVAKVNVIISGINVLPTSGLDGESALSALCGVSSISEMAKIWLTDKNRRHKLLHFGLPGYGCFCVFSLTFISRIILWIIIGLDIISIFLVFY